MPTVTCASCGVSLNVDQRKMGTAIACPACKGPAIATQKSAPLSIQCPDCGSDNCQRMQIIHDMGTAHSSGAGLSTGGVGFDIGAAVTSFRKTTQSALAAQCAPPKVRLETSSAAIVAILGVLVATIGTFLTAGAIAVNASGYNFGPDRWSPIWIPVGMLSMAAGAWMLVSGQMRSSSASGRQTLSREKPRFTDWRRLRAGCLKCGPGLDSRNAIESACGSISDLPSPSPQDIRAKSK